MVKLREIGVKDGSLSQVYHQQTLALLRDWACDYLQLQYGMHLYELKQLNVCNLLLVRHAHSPAESRVEWAFQALSLNLISKEV